MNKVKRSRWCNPLEGVGTDEGGGDYDSGYYNFCREAGGGGGGRQARPGGAAPLVYIASRVLFTVYMQIIFIRRRVFLSSASLDTKFSMLFLYVYCRFNIPCIRKFRKFYFVCFL